MESLLESLLESTVVGAYLVQNWKFRYVNPALARIFGYQPEEIIYRLGPLDLTHPDDREMVGRNIRSCIEGRVVHVHSVFRGLCKDGSTIYCELYGSCTEYGGKLAVVGTLVDITERKQAEEALRESEERYRTLVERSGLAIFVINAEGRIVFFNRHVCELSGHEPGELKGRLFTNWVHPGDRERVLDYHHRLAGDFTVPEWYESRWLCKDGSFRHVEAGVTPIVKEGRVVGSRVCLRDITERRQAEEALRESEERYRDLVETARDVIFSLSTEGVFTSLNRVFEVLTGWSRSQWIGEHFGGLVYPGDIPFAEELFQQILKGESIPPVDIRIRLKSGGYAVYELTGAPIVRDGRIVGALGVGRDITERKRAEELIEHLNLVLRAIRSTNRLIAREKDRDRLLKEACKNLIETRGYHNSWIALFDESGRLMTAAESGLDKAFLPLAERLEHGKLPDCARKALSQSGTTITEDPLATCGDCPLSDKYAGRGALTTRLEHSGRVYGLLSASIPKALVADEEEQVLFQGIAGDIAFALHSIALEDERKQAEDELKAARERLELAMDAGEHGFWDWNLDTDDVYLSPCWYTMLGYEPGELPMRLETWVGLMHPEDRGTVVPQVQEYVENAQPYEVEFRLRTKYGGWRWISGRGKAFEKDANGQPHRAVGVHVDITERKQAEEALRGSVERYRTLVESSLTGVFIHQDYKFIFVNERFAWMHGYTPEELIGMDYLELIHPDDKEAASQRTAQRIEGEVLPECHEIRRITKDGKTIWCEVMATGIGYLGRPAIMGNIVDITGRKQAEKGMKEAINRLYSVLEQTVYAFASTVEKKDPYTSGHQRRVARLALAIAKEMGLSREECRGIYMTGLIHDIGKISVPAEILSKPSRLTDVEFGMLKAHPQVGYDILKEVDFLWPLADMVLQHHERLDGSGYPQGLKNGEILLGARILGVADVVEAMASHRPYRPALGIDAALEEISRGKGTLYDPQVVDICTRLFREKGYQMES
jgi:PAS domain S-box-containing protein